VLIGGAGIDRLDYSQSPTYGAYDGVRVSLLTNYAATNDAEGDTFSGIENVTGSAHSDFLQGDDGANVLRGLASVDQLHGEAGDDRLEGGADADWLEGGAGVDITIGGAGDDRHFVDNASDVVIEAGGEGIDGVFASVSYALPSGAEIERLLSWTLSFTTPIDLTGNSIGNEIRGNDGANRIDGGGGVDQLIGYGGSDLYFVDNAGDSVVEFGGQGLDEVRTSVSWILTAGSDVEIMRTTDDDGTAAINMTGNASGNVLRGNNGDNVLNGGGGNDELTGRGGADWFLFDTPLDAAFNIDVIADFNIVDDTIVLENTIFAAFANGPLAAERFVIGAAAQDASDCIIYNNVTGALLYDSDGNGRTAAIQFAAVMPGLELTHLDFLVV
jgi:Ca2+-binding RTX toxin-like protein